MSIPTAKALQPAAAGPARPDRRPGAADRSRYDALIAVLQARRTARRFAPGATVTDEEYRLILEAARLSPSGANAQPWQFIAVRPDETKAQIAEVLVKEHMARAAGAQGVPAVDYRRLATAPGLLVVAGDFRLSWVFSGLMAGTELDQRFHAHAERVILQSIAAATMAAHLAAAALGHLSWWISVLGLDETQAALHALLGVPADLTITDIMAFGPAAGPAPRRWKKDAADISSWDRFDMSNFRSVSQIDAWVADLRHEAAFKRLK